MSARDRAPARARPSTGESASEEGSFSWLRILAAGNHGRPFPRDRAGGSRADQRLQMQQRPPTAESTAMVTASRRWLPRQTCAMVKFLASRASSCTVAGARLRSHGTPQRLLERPLQNARHNSPSVEVLLDQRASLAAMVFVVSFGGA